MPQPLPPGFGEWTGDAKYELRGTLGAGAMGVVLDGFDRAIERRVAIKVVRKPDPDDTEAIEAAARFKREAQAAGRLSHPNIVGIHDYGENDSTAWIVMELVEGGTLKSLLDRDERLPMRETLRIMGQVLSALSYAHGRGVIHRDIKPANVMLSAEGDAKLADFGIARLENSALTQIGTLMGTPSYMAPEQLRGEALDARADIWAAGVMLYQLLTGEKPFPGGLSAVMHKVLNTEPVAPSALSASVTPAMDAVVLKALAKRPDERWPDALSFAQALEGAARAPSSPEAVMDAPADATVIAPRARTVTSPPPPPAPAPAATMPAPAAVTSRTAKRPAWLLPVAGLALVGAGVAGFLFWPKDTSQSGPAMTSNLPTPAGPSVRAPGGTGTGPAGSVMPGAAPPAPSSTASRREGPAQGSTAQGGDGAAGIRPEGSRPVEPGQAPPGAPLPEPPRSAVPATPPTATTVPASPIAPASGVATAPPRIDWRAVAASAVAAAPCGLLTPRVEATGFVLGGVLPADQLDAIRRSLAARDLPAGAAKLDVATFRGSFCRLADALRPIVAAPGDAPRVTVDGDHPLRKGEFLRFSVQMPDWADNLHVAYATSDGSVVRLQPGAAESGGATVRLGDPRPGFPGWEIDEPFGTDLLLVVASKGPLFASPAPQVQDQSAYADSVARALDAARAEGRRVALTPVVVDTAAR